MTDHTQDNQIGYFLERHDLIHIDIKNLLQELQICLFEANIIHATINNILNNSFIPFDSTIGDRKCQSRASMLLDIIKSNHAVFSEYKPKIEQIITKINILLKNIESFTQNELISLAKDLKTTSLYIFFSNHQIILNIPHELRIASLCYLTTLQEKTLKELINSQITPSKIKKIINHRAKSKLCDLSIEYERELAQKYHLTDVSICLEQLEKKGFCTMTAFFPSFKPIFEKMKHKQQSFAKKTTHFCRCGGVKEDSFEILNFNNGQWHIVPYENHDPNAAIMTIYGFQFPGSFEQLKQILQIPLEAISIPKPYHKPCTCNQPFTKPNIDNIEHGILANFAHHPQFTTEAEIDFAGLGLVGSDLQKEYDFLKTLSGFNAQDMNKFTINHIYAATIKEALEQDSPSILAMVTSHRKDLVSHHDAHCPC